MERGAREKPVPSTARRLLARPGIGAWSGRFGQRQEKSCATGTPRAGGCQGGAGRSEGLWRPQPHHAVLEASLTPGRLFLSVYSLSLPLLAQCPAHLAAGRGAPQEGRQGAPGGSGAALAHAPGPGAVQLPRPQLALLRARPCTSLLNRIGAGPRDRTLRPKAPPPCRPSSSAPLSVSFSLVEAFPARPFAHPGDSPLQGPLP